MEESHNYDVSGLSTWNWGREIKNLKYLQTPSVAILFILQDQVVMALFHTTGPAIVDQTTANEILLSFYGKLWHRPYLLLFPHLTSF